MSYSTKSGFDSGLLNCGTEKKLSSVFSGSWVEVGEAALFIFGSGCHSLIWLRPTV